MKKGPTMASVDVNPVCPESAKNWSAAHVPVDLVLARIKVRVRFVTHTPCPELYPSRTYCKGKLQMFLHKLRKLPLPLLSYFLNGRALSLVINTPVDIRLSSN